MVKKSTCHPERSVSEVKDLKQFKQDASVAALAQHDAPPPFELLNEHISIPHETFEKLSAYHDLLLKWQSKINLISNDTIKDVWRRHFLDSLQLLSYIDNKEKTIVDLGSGAGFPAMALAIAGFKNVHLVESDIRKSAFLREVARVTETKVTIHNCRIEEWSSCEGRSTSTGSNNIGKDPSLANASQDDIIFTSRACASLDKLLDLIYDKFSHETICFFHKGKNYSMECEEASKNWQYDISVTPSIVDSEGVIVKISNLHKR